MSRLLFAVQSLKPALINMRGLFRMIVMLDRRLKQLGEEEVIDLSNSLAYYVLDATTVSISVISL